MKKMFVLSVFALLVGFCLVSAAPAQAAYVEMGPFLLEHYGWTIDLSLQKALFSSSNFSWDIACDSSRQTLPKEGKTYGWVCRQKNTVFWTTILWLVPGTNPTPFEEEIFESMAGDQYRTYKVTCTTTEGAGTYKDCDVKLTNGTFYVSFYYFETKLPTGDPLGFILYVKNASLQGSDKRVKDKLRELVSAIRPAPSTIHAAK
jgi:hypothetical protein